MTIHLHCGGHKTASTFMKTFLRKNKELFESRQIAVHVDRFRGREVTAEDIIDLAKQDYQNSYQQIIISEDANIIGRMPGIFQNQDSNFFSTNSILKFADLIGKINRQYKTKFLLCVRRQDTYLESCYKFRKTQGAKYSLEHFLNEVRELNLSWYDLVDGVAGYIGKENCTVVPYEILKTSQPQFIATFFQNILPIEKEKIAIPSPKNKGASQMMMAVVDYFDTNFQDIPPKHRKQILSIIKKYEKASKPSVSLFPQETNQKILQNHSVVNQKLFSNYIPSMPANYYEFADLKDIDAKHNISTDRLLVTNNN